MRESNGCDLIVIGGGVAGAATALAVARSAAFRRGPQSRRTATGGPRKAAPSVCLVQTDEPGATSGGEPADAPAAAYSVLNPAAASGLPSLKAKLAQLTDGSFRGMMVIGARDGRRAEFRSRSICGYFPDPGRLLRGLLALCRSAGVKIVRPAGPARFFADDHAVYGQWDGGRCEGRIALLADPDVAVGGRADGLGFRHHWLANRMFRCCGVSFSASPRVLNEAFGPSRRLVTVWQLESLEGIRNSSDSERGVANSELKDGSRPGRSAIPRSGFRSPNWEGHGGHAWIMPRKGSVSVGVMVGRPESSANHVEPEALMDRVLGELRFLNALPAQVSQRTGPAVSWTLPLAAALEIETHVAKRSLAVGLAGGFVAALSGQWLYPTVHAATLAAAVSQKALPAARPQDVLAQFSVRWRQELADYLRSPNTRLAFLLPLVFGNQQIADRFSRAYLFGENF